ncbi:MAG: hypothetical protein KF889_15170 [Alphaproteobacteria bacterium]|nr:hypothetical protein [Alphaproteobacteria bacterium]MCW5740284.1 hypothetical protein [Alphaproteobacteria bacterium]
MSSRFVLGAVLLGAFVLPAAVDAQQKPLPYGTVKIGDQLKQTIATVLQLRSGDRACTMIMKDSAGKEFTELASFDFCQWNIIGKRVTLTYRMEEVMAEACQGNPRCTRKDRIPLIVDVKMIR